MKRVSLYNNQVEILFDEARHRYSMGENLMGFMVGAQLLSIPSVTGALGVINKPALIQWAANMTVADLLNKTGRAITDTKSLNEFMAEQQQINRGFHDAPYLHFSLADLNDSRSFHKRRKDEAAEKGKDAHALLSEMLIPFIGKTTGEFYQNCFDTMSLIVLSKSVLSFIVWCKNNPDFKIVGSEQIVFSLIGYAGMYDLTLQALCDLPGAGGYVGGIPKDTQIVVDFKTGNGIYEDMRLQISAYAACIFEEKKTACHRALLHLQKDGSEAKFYNYGAEDYEKGAPDFGAFLNCLGLHNWIRANGWNQGSK